MGRGATKRLGVGRVLPLQKRKKKGGGGCATSFSHTEGRGTQRFEVVSIQEREVLAILMECGKSFHNLKKKWGGGRGA